MDNWKTKLIIVVLFTIVLESVFSDVEISSDYSSLIAVANEMNQYCPVTVDKETRLDNTTVTSENTFQYNYTIVNHSKKEIQDIEAMRKIVATNLYDYIKTNPDFEDFKKHKVTLAFSYRDKEGVFLFRIQFSYDEYKDE